jgi:elongation factor G
MSRRRSSRPRSPASNRILPVRGFRLANSGCSALLEFLSKRAFALDLKPEVVMDTEGMEMEYGVNMDKPATALVIRTQIDQFSGRLSFFKVFSGKLLPDMELFNVRENKKEKIGKLYIAQGKKLEEVQQLCAGDMGVTSKVMGLKTNDTITLHDDQFSFAPLRLPQPSLPWQSPRSPK